MAQALIERVYVDGDSNIEIVFRYRDEYKELCTYLEGGKLTHENGDVSFAYRARMRICEPAKKNESESISNQRSLLREYVSGHAELVGSEILEFVTMAGVVRTSGVPL